MRLVTRTERRVIWTTLTVNVCELRCPSLWNIRRGTRTGLRSSFSRPRCGLAHGLSAFPSDNHRVRLPVSGGVAGHFGDWPLNDRLPDVRAAKLVPKMFDLAVVQMAADALPSCPQRQGQAVEAVCVSSNTDSWSRLPC
jgi:hypothetical protein